VTALNTHINCDELDIEIAGRLLVKDLSLSVSAGQFVCILGRNGVGKTLSLHTLAGLRSPHKGTVEIAGTDIRSMSRMEIARRLGLLMQVHDDAFPVSVLETALMGRHPRLGFWQWESDKDRTAAVGALEQFGLQGFEQRITATLSGGERRRAALATLMVQNPQIWLLDEPTNHLDPHHQLDVLQQLKNLTEKGKSVITTLHDPVMASRYADFALLLYGDGQWEFGPARDMLTPDYLEKLYGTPFQRYFNAARDESVTVPV